MCTTPVLVTRCNGCAGEEKERKTEAEVHGQYQACLRMYQQVRRLKTGLLGDD